MQLGSCLTLQSIGCYSCQVSSAACIFLYMTSRIKVMQVSLTNEALIVLSVIVLGVRADIHHEFIILTQF
jgi:hypothetical protein